METRLVNPNDCHFIQSRVVLDPRTVLEYSAMMDAGVAFDPCKGIITATGAILIYDGNHRGESAKVNGCMLEVELLCGTDQDATWLASGANTRHGLRRTTDDIVKAVKEALAHPRALGKSDREIARHCGCDHKTVGKYRKELEASGERPQMPTKTVQRNGAEYQMTIPMPPAPEPEPARDASPQVFDDMFEHFRQKYAPGPGNVSTVLTDKDIQPGTKHGKLGAYQWKKVDGPWTCPRCASYFPIGVTVYVYQDSDDACPLCIERVDPCARCKHARGTSCADDCCATCATPCNIQQRCRMMPKTPPQPKDPERERLYHDLLNPDVPDVELPELCALCSHERDDAVLCQECREDLNNGRALREYYPDLSVGERFRDYLKQEDELNGSNFEFNSIDRNKILQAGLRIFRGSDIEKALKEYSKAHSTTMEGVDISWGSWKIAERFATKKALKDRIRTLEQEPDVVIDGRV